MAAPSCSSAIEKYALIEPVSVGFWFVGDHTRCGELIEALAPGLGVPPLAISHNTQSEWEDRVQWKTLHVENLSSRRLSQIRQGNELDQLLWENWRNDLSGGWGTPRANTTRARPRVL